MSSVTRDQGFDAAVLVGRSTPARARRLPGPLVPPTGVELTGELHRVSIGARPISRCRSAIAARAPSRRLTDSRSCAEPSRRHVGRPAVAAETGPPRPGRGAVRPGGGARRVAVVGTTGVRSSPPQPQHPIEASSPQDGAIPAASPQDGAIPAAPLRASLRREDARPQYTPGGIWGDAGADPAEFRPVPASPGPRRESRVHCGEGQPYLRGGHHAQRRPHQGCRLPKRRPRPWPRDTSCACRRIISQLTAAT